MGYKSDRTAEDIKREITALVRELKDPRVTSQILTVVRVEIAHDLSYAKVYVSSLGGIEEAKEACKALNGNAKGYIRKEVGLRLSLRKTPDIRFIPDDSIEKGIEMFRVLNTGRKKEEE
ncbi:MAG: 30S ribosome-binding factor RbfA [Clostridia bacterium]|nr:30S ribosome-binding factor RbfA [Clostridia bacterium]